MPLAGIFMAAEVKKMTGHTKKTDVPPKPIGGILLLLSLFLVIGAIVGSLLFTNRLPQADLLARLEANMTVSRVRLFFVLLKDAVKYLLPLFLCAYFRLGVYVVPGLFALKGFTTARLVAAFLRTYGGWGYAAAFSAYFANSFFVILCMLILGCQAMRLSALQKSMPRSRHSFLRVHPEASYYSAAFICMGFCVAYALVGCILTPLLSSAALSLIS